MPVIHSSTTAVQVHFRCRPWDAVKERSSVWDQRSNPTGILRNVIEIRDGRKVVFNEPKPGFPGEGRTSNVKARSFDANRAYPMEVDQDEVYKGSAAPLLDGIFSGYNATMLAYGATGCGKTHTMTGPPEDPGIIPRTMQAIFDRKEAEAGEFDIFVKVSIIEVYNEKVRDLLDGFSPGASASGPKSSATKPDDLKILTDPVTRQRIVRSIRAEPSNLHEVRELLDYASSKRATSATLANDNSSRSHQILEILVERQTCCGGGEQTVRTNGMLRIVDLAGSEKVHATEGHKDRAKEGQQINKSLHTLSRVIELLATKAKTGSRPFIPYRESVLTRLLEASLSGNCQTVMIICISPSSQHLIETHRSIHFATTAAGIQMESTANTAVVTARFKEVGASVVVLQKKVQELEAEVLRLNKENKVLSTGTSAQSDTERTRTLQELDNLRQDLMRQISTVEQGAMLRAFNEVSLSLQQRLGDTTGFGPETNAEYLAQLAKSLVVPNESAIRSAIQQSSTLRTDGGGALEAFMRKLSTSTGLPEGHIDLVKARMEVLQQEWRVKALSAELNGYRQAALQNAQAMGQVARSYATHCSTTVHGIQQLEQSHDVATQAAVGIVRASLDAFQSDMSAAYASSTNVRSDSIGSATAIANFHTSTSPKPIKRALPASASDSSMSASSTSRPVKGKGKAISALPRPIVAASPRKPRAGRVTYSARAATPKKNPGSESRGVRWGGDDSLDQQPLEEIRLFARESSGSSQLSALIRGGREEDEGEWSNVSDEAIGSELLGKRPLLVGRSGLATSFTPATNSSTGTKSAPRISNWADLHAQSRAPATIPLVPIPLMSVDELEEGASSRESSGEQADAEVSETGIVPPKPTSRLGPPSRSAAPLGPRRTVAASTSTVPVPLVPAKPSTGRRTSYLAPTQSATNRASVRAADRGPVRPSSPPSKRAGLSSSTESQRENGLGPRRTPKTKRRFSGLPTRAVSNASVRTVNLPGPTAAFNDVFAPLAPAPAPPPPPPPPALTIAAAPFDLGLGAFTTIAPSAAPGRNLLPIAEAASPRAAGDTTAAPSSALRNRASVANFGATTSRFQGSVSKRASMMNLGGAGGMATKALFKPATLNQPAPWR